MKLNYKRTVYVGFAFFLIYVFWQTYDSIIPKILTDKFGMSQMWSGIIMALDNVFALFLLPIFGAISDKYNGKKGRRTPFIIVGTIIASIAFVVLSFGDYWQLKNISDVSASTQIEFDISREALETLYDADLQITTPRGLKLKIQDTFTREEYSTFFIYKSGSSNVNPDYVNYVVPARQVYAWKKTMESPGTLVFFVIMLLIVLLAMSVFRTPAVALMPDVTVKPLRSNANAIINLMGTAGGTVVILLGLLFQTGKSENSLMTYLPFFTIVAFIMLLSLMFFIWKVDEPRFVKEMHEESKRLGISEDDDEVPKKGEEVRRLTRDEKVSLILILVSVALWFMGYNAVTSKYSVYAGTVLNKDYNKTFLLAQITAAASFIPIGYISAKIGRKKMILTGIFMLTTSFLAASFLDQDSSIVLINILFSMAGIGWASINVNSYPMVVELSKNGDIGKYTGFYYTASMIAQTITPILSGLFLDIKLTLLFPYATVFAALSFVTMFFVRHGDAKPEVKKNFLENFDVDD